MVKQQTGKIFDELETVENIPVFLYDVWRLYNVLSQRREVVTSLNSVIHRPISFIEMQAYFDVMKESVSLLEREAIIALDDAYIQAIREGFRDEWVI